MGCARHVQRQVGVSHRKVVYPVEMLIFAARHEMNMAVDIRWRPGVSAKMA